MINKTKLDRINSAVAIIKNIDSTLTYGKRSHYVLTYGNDNEADVSVELIDNALLAYKEKLTGELKQLGYEENYVEVTTRG